MLVYLLVRRRVYREALHQCAAAAQRVKVDVPLHSSPQPLLVQLYQRIAVQVDNVHRVHSVPFVLAAYDVRHILTRLDKRQVPVLVIIRQLVLVILRPFAAPRPEVNFIAEAALAYGVIFPETVISVPQPSSLSEMSQLPLLSLRSRKLPLQAAYIAAACAQLRLGE